MNLYSYAFADPISLRDSDGRRPEGLAEARNPYMRSVYEPRQTDRSINPRNMTVYLGATYNFTLSTGGMLSGGRYEYYDDNQQLAESGWYWAMSARTGFELGVGVGYNWVPGPPREGLGDLDITAGGTLFGIVSVNVAVPVLDPGNASAGGGFSLGPRFGASLGGGGINHYPDRRFRLESYDAEAGTAVIRVETTGTRLGERQTCSESDDGSLTCQ